MHLIFDFQTLVALECNVSTFHLEPQDIAFVEVYNDSIPYGWTQQSGKTAADLSVRRSAGQMFFINET